MVTTNPSLALTASATASAPKAAPARPISAVVTDAVNSSAQPGPALTGTFGSVLDQLGQASAAASTEATAPATTPASVPSPPNPVTPLAMPGQPIPTPPPGQTTSPSATLASAAKSNAATKSTASKTTATDNSTNENEPVVPTSLVAASIPIPPLVPIAPAPAAGVPVTTSAQTGDPALPSLAATTNVTAADASQIGGANQLTTGPAEKPTTALVAAQAAVTPSAARSTGRTSDNDPADTALTQLSKLVTDNVDRPTDDQSGSPPLAAGLPVTMGNPLVTPPAMAQVAPNATPTPAAVAAQSPASQPGSFPPTPSARSARPTAEPIATTTPLPASPSAPVPDISASSNPSFATIVATASLGAAGTPTPVSSEPIPRLVQQTPVPSSPATQVAHAIIEPIQVLMSSATQAASTVSHITTIQITPVELGRVDIRIERSADGPAKIELVAERPETLSRLVHDQSQLQQALDQAGVPQAGRTIDFSLAPTPTPDLAASSSVAGGATTGGSNSGNEQQRQGGTYANRAFGTANETALVAATHIRSIRTGIDIMA